MRRLIRLARPQFPRMAVALVLIAVCAVALLAIPLVVKQAIGVALRTNHLDFPGRLIALLLVLVIGSALANVLSFILMFDVAVAISSGLRLRYIRHLIDLPVQFHRSSQPGELLDRLLTGVVEVEWFFQNNVASLFAVTITISGAAVMMFLTSWKLSLLVVCAVPLLALMVRKLFRKARQLQERGRGLSGRLTGSIGALLLGIDVVKAYNSQDRSMERLTRQQDEFFLLWKRGARFVAAVEPVMIAVAILLFLLFLLFGGFLLAGGELRPDELIAFLMYLMLLMPQTRVIGSIVNRWQQVRIGLNRLDDILELVPERDHEDARTLPVPVEGRIELRDVSMSYDNREPALRNVSFSLGRGERVGLVGESGAGKTTLFNLLLRFYEPDSGVITIDGIDVRSVQLASLRSALALVPQDTTLFDDTIAENVRYARASATDAEVEEACHLAQISDFVESLPDGYQTVLSDRGMNLSGGQRQRLAIARALLKKAPILLMDEPTSSLDAQTEEHLRRAMEVAMEGRTTLIIAHRLATVAHLPRIIVLSRGRILADGSHQELLETCPLYAEIVATQMMSQSPAAESAAQSETVSTGAA